VSDDLAKIKCVSSSTLSKIRAAGFTTIEALSVTPIKEVAARSGVNDDTAFKVCEEAYELRFFEGS
jgi:hypothetical protein